MNSATRMGRTALTKACWNGEIETVRLLLSHPGVDLEIRDSQGRTALHMAVWG